MEEEEEEEEAGLERTHGGDANDTALACHLSISGSTSMTV